MNAPSGAPLSAGIAAGIVLVVALFFWHLLRALPQPVLAAVVLVAVAGLFKVSALKQLDGAVTALSSSWRWQPSSACSGKVCCAV
jgi:MFS superfamily sulfate permease-like transporter